VFDKWSRAGMGAIEHFQLALSTPVIEETIEVLSTRRHGRLSDE